jgi:hypothetical protein
MAPPDATRLIDRCGGRRRERFLFENRDSRFRRLQPGAIFV